MEVKHRCNQVLELGFPLGGLAKLFAQEWEGDVTVVMPATVSQVSKVITIHKAVSLIALTQKPKLLSLSKVDNLQWLNCNLLNI